MKDGPQEHTRPAETYKSCSGCSHYDHLRWQPFIVGGTLHIMDAGC